MEKDNFKMEVHARGYAVIRGVKEQRTRQLVGGTSSKNRGANVRTLNFFLYFPVFFTYDLTLLCSSIVFRLKV